MAMSDSDVNEIMRYVAKRYAVMGVLERTSETLEVMRCRFPWLAATKLQHANPTTPYPEHLLNNDALMRSIIRHDYRLYEFSGMVLSADIACCRQH